MSHSMTDLAVAMTITSKVGQLLHSLQMQVPHTHIHNTHTHTHTHTNAFIADHVNNKTTFTGSQLISAITAKHSAKCMCALDKTIA